MHGTAAPDILGPYSIFTVMQSPQPITNTADGPRIVSVLLLRGAHCITVKAREGACSWLDEQAVQNYVRACFQLLIQSWPFLSALDLTTAVASPPDLRPRQLLQRHAPLSFARLPLPRESGADGVLKCCVAQSGHLHRRGCAYAAR